MRRARGPSVLLFGDGPTSAAHAAAAAFARMSVVGVAARDASSAAERAAELGTPALGFDDIFSGRVAAGIAVVSSPVERRAADVIALLDLGVAVAVEGPMCATLAEADAIVATADRRPEHLLYAEHIAFAPVVQQMLSLVGGLGRLGHLEVRAMQRPQPGGVGGGALVELGSHPLALALLVANAAGEGAPISVEADLTPDDDGGDRHAVVHLTYPSGLRARIETGWRAEPGAQWDAQAASGSGVVRAEVLPVPQLERNGEPVQLPTPTAPVAQIEQYGYVAQLRSLADAMDTRTRPTLGASFGRVVMDVLCAAYRSGGRSGTPEALPFSGDRERTPIELWRGA